MAEEKKRVRKSTKKTTQKKRTSSQDTKDSSFSISVEIKGLFVMALAAGAIADICGLSLGVVGPLLGGLFTYTFGFSGILVAGYIFYVGFRLLYDGWLPQITRRGIYYVITFIFLITMVTLWRVPLGREFELFTWSQNGGVLGALLGSLFRSILGEIGAIIGDGILVLVMAMILTKMSLRKGLHKAKDTASVGLEKATEIASDRVEVIKDRFHEWNEERKEQRKAYDWEKDTRYLSEEELRLREARKKAMADGEAKTTFVNDVGTAQGEEGIESTFIADVQSTHVEEESETTFMADMKSTHEEEEGISHKNEDESTSMDEVLETKDSESISAGEPAATKEVASNEDDLSEEEYDESAYEIEPVEGSPVPSIIDTKEDRAEVSVTTDEEGRKIYRVERPYVFPSLDMLSRGKSNPVTTEEVSHNANLLETTLASFGVTAKVVNATQGPTVTRYELEPAPGTKVSRIINLQDDLKLSLAAADIRMEAPIPGKSAVGIEVPNKNVSAVHLRDVLDCEEFRKASGGIPVGLGKDIADQPIITDLAKMPHMLVAGSTGSGKSVCVNTLISSILFSRKPEEVKLILIDPKMVELSVYNGIPHLMVPVVTDMKKAASVLRWAVREMESRYRTLSTAGVRNIDSYNKQHPNTAMPLVLIVIDELADLMMTAPDVEEAISRLAAKARAAGIHMVLATQRPTTDVITGTIKANVPSRIAFAVASQLDSRTILDQGGAERLLGKGDMLFNPIGANKPIRIQGAFISDDEVEQVVSFVKTQGEPEYNDEVVAASDDAEVEEGGLHSDVEQDEYLERAVSLILTYQQASASLLQRRLRVGYSRAGRIIDTLEELGIIGPNNGSKARDILMSREQVRERFFPNLEDE